jgi:hypothetical protein
MKRSELKQIIIEVIEESKLHEEVYTPLKKKKIGLTQSGKIIYNFGQTDFDNFTAEDHKDAMDVIKNIVTKNGRSIFPSQLDTRTEKILKQNFRHHLDWYEEKSGKLKNKESSKMQYGQAPDGFISGNRISLNG